MDLSRMMKTIKENNLKFFPSFLWLTTTILNEYDKIRVAVKDDKLGLYTTLTPFYPTFHIQDHSISMVWTEYSSSLLKFHNSYEENKRLYGDNKGFMAIPKTIPPENACNISVLPWFNFTSFSPTFFLSFPLLFSFYWRWQVCKRRWKDYFPSIIHCASRYNRWLSYFRVLLSFQRDGWHFPPLSLLV